MRFDAVPLLAAGTQIAAPIALATGDLALPPGVPWWAALVATVLGPACTSMLWFLGKAGALGLAGWLSGRAKEKRALAGKLLTDKDPKNDASAHELRISAAADEGTAEALRAAANNKGTAP